MDERIVTGGRFLVYCQMNEDSCVFLIHVPELHRYEPSTAKFAAEMAYMYAAMYLNEQPRPALRRVYVATRGVLLYDRILQGDYRPDEEGFPQDARQIAQSTLTASMLEPLFAPPDETRRSPTSPGSTPTPPSAEPGR